MAASITQYKLFFTFEKEEAYLERMSAEGFHLKKVSGPAYTFEQGAPEQRIYRIDFRKLDHDRDVADYVALFADSGWTCINPRRATITSTSYNYYFYTLRESGAEDIFSDSTSKAQRYLRYANYMVYMWVALSLPYVVLFSTGAYSVKEWGYLTPGLWEMPTAQFIPHFLFETPFVLMRMTFIILPVLVVLIWAYFVFRYYQLYKKALVEE